MSEYIFEIISKTSHIAVLLPVFAAVFIVYLSSMEGRREKIYLDFFLVEKFGREDIKKHFSIGYITSGLSVISVAVVLVWLKDTCDSFWGRFSLYVLSALGMIVYCWVVYNNTKPEKYEVRKWASFNKKAQKILFRYRAYERVIFIVIFASSIEIAPENSIIVVLLILLLIDYMIETLLDTICIKKILSNCINDVVCIVDDNEKLYAIIKSNQNFFYCLETEMENETIKVFIDRIKCFPFGEKLAMRRVRFNKMERVGEIGKKYDG